MDAAAENRCGRPRRSAQSPAPARSGRGRIQPGECQEHSIAPAEAIFEQRRGIGRIAAISPSAAVRRREFCARRYGEMRVDRRRLSGGRRAACRAPIPFAERARRVRRQSAVAVVPLISHMLSEEDAPRCGESHAARTGMVSSIVRWRSNGSITRCLYGTRSRARRQARSSRRFRALRRQCLTRIGCRRCHGQHATKPPWNTLSVTRARPKRVNPTLRRPQPHPLGRIGSPRLRRALRTLQEISPSRRARTTASFRKCVFYQGAFPHERGRKRSRARIDPGRADPPRGTLFITTSRRQAHRPPGLGQRTNSPVALQRFSSTCILPRRGRRVRRAARRERSTPGRDQRARERETRAASGRRDLRNLPARNPQADKRSASATSALAPPAHAAHRKARTDIAGDSRCGSAHSPENGRVGRSAGAAG